MANQSGIASRNGSESRRRRRQCALEIATVEWPDACCGTNLSKERLDFMAWSADDDYFRANARVWDFAMPLKS